jgi:hypothetical protein
MKLNVFSTIPFFSVPGHAATWTSQRNWDSRTSYDERNIPSGQGARQGTVKLGMRPRIFKSRARWWNNAANSRNHSLAQHGRGGRYRNVAIMDDRSVKRNHNVTVMGGVTISQKEEEETEGNVCSIADETSHQNHDEALMGDVVIISQKKEVKTVETIHSIADETAHHNHDVALMGDLVTVNQKKEVNTEGTVRCAADETTHQTLDEVIEPQDFKKPVSVSAAELKSKTQHKEQDDADFCFLQSLIPDMKKLSNRKKLKFKELIISSISKLLEED